MDWPVLAPVPAEDRRRLVARLGRRDAESIPDGQTRMVERELPVAERGTSMPRVAEGLLLEFGDDGEMVRWPDAVHRGGAGQAG
jgi:hypothetical protein